MRRFASTTPRTRLLGVNRIEYREGDKIAILEGERLPGHPSLGLAFWFEKGHEWVVPAERPISLEEMRRIKIAVERDFREHGTNIEVELP